MELRLSGCWGISIPSVHYRYTLGLLWTGCGSGIQAWGLYFAEYVKG